MSDNINELIYGINPTEGITSVEVLDGNIYVYFADGSHELIPYHYWFLSDKKGSSSTVLNGEQQFKYFNCYDEEKNYVESLYKAKKVCNVVNVYNKTEQALIYTGITLYKGIKLDQVSVLSFDIEANGLMNADGLPIAKTPEVYLITNTFRDNAGVIHRKMFSLDEYDDCNTMIQEWCQWVRKMDPNVICGHNIFSYDLPYLKHVYGEELPLGRNNKDLLTESYVSKFRKDSSQSYEYHNVKCFGRQFIDTMFLAFKYDIARNYVSYGLKQIIKQEGLVKEGRQYYDAGSIAKNWHILEERAKIKQYALEDADDSLALYDLMIPSFFYYCRSVPMSLQHINNTATGRQINSFLIRSYLQEGYSIPRASEINDTFEGAISYGNPGIYRNCWKIDVASLYPSIMREYKVYDKKKDPNCNFYKMVEYFTVERLKNKKLSKESKDRYYKDVEQSQKLVINSCYGMMGANGLNFNSPANAAFVTRKGREILQKSILWATNKQLKKADKLTKTGKNIKKKDSEVNKSIWILE